MDWQIHFIDLYCQVCDDFHNVLIKANSPLKLTIAKWVVFFLGCKPRV